MNVIRAVLMKDPALPAGFDRDLGAILGKALRKEPQSRYGSVDELRQDVDNYLHGLPVTARHGDTAYVVGKYIRRNSVGIGVAILLLILLVTAGASWWAVERSNDELDRAMATASSLSLALDSQFSPGARVELTTAAHHAADLLISQVLRPGIPRDTQMAILNQLMGLAELLGHPTARVEIGDVDGAVRILRETLVETEGLYGRYPGERKTGEFAFEKQPGSGNDAD